MPLKWLYRQLFLSHYTLPTTVLVTHARLTSLLTTQDWSQTTALTTDRKLPDDWYKQNYFSRNVRKMKWSLILDRRNQTTHRSWSRVLIRCWLNCWYNRTGWPGVKHQVTYSSDSRTLCIPNNKTKTLDTAFSSAAPSVWHSLPLEIMTFNHCT